ncbi:MAG TPA: sugar transferase [Terracidiphilus sp.]|jgi:lipopolysaccharide/colanic/teichoic acid biosynthesis glycosyltransferase|nr:sugar transferase [Terracidiphilus sp.]
MATSNSWYRVNAHLAPEDWASGATRQAAPPAKRALDVALSVTGLVLGLPLLALGAGAVQLQSRGTVLCRTRCRGLGGRGFELLQLRTVDAAGRTTYAGRVLRRLGLDGLPQLVNVLRGEMSIVGPTPVPAGDRDQASVKHLRRFNMAPGMTGLWALGACREAAPGEYFSPDERYRSNWSVWLDLAIVARTLGRVAGGLDEEAGEDRGGVPA